MWNNSNIKRITCWGRRTKLFRGYNCIFDSLFKRGGGRKEAEEEAVLSSREREEWRRVKVFKREMETSWWNKIAGGGRQAENCIFPGFDPSPFPTGTFNFIPRIHLRDYFSFRGTPTYLIKKK